MNELRSPLSALLLALSGCCWLGPGESAPAGITRWQSTDRPTSPLHVKAAAYQTRIEEHHLVPEGLLRYERRTDRPEDLSYGDFADGPFHTGIYLASQAFRYAATRDPAALAQTRKSLNGLRLLMEVTGKRGLLARYFSPVGTIPGSERAEGNEKGWRPSATHPELCFRADVSKDQYAGFIFGLGAALALVDDPEVRRVAGDLAGAAVDHLIEHHLQIIDVDGEATTHSNLSGHIFGVPIGINALIVLAIAKVAAEGCPAPRYSRFYEELVASQYFDAAYHAHFTVLGVGNRVNDNMAYLAMTPLLLLEKRRDLREALGAAEDRLWAAVRTDRNAFFSFVHALRLAEDREGVRAGRISLYEFPENKIEWPVDLTREGFEFERHWLNTRKCVPRATTGVPVYLRPRSSSTWASDPFRLVGNLTHHGTHETAGGDYLVAYWLGRWKGFVRAEE